MRSSGSPVSSVEDMRPCCFSVISPGPIAGLGADPLAHRGRGRLPHLRLGAGCFGRYQGPDPAAGDGIEARASPTAVTQRAAKPDEIGLEGHERRHIGGPERAGYAHDQPFAAAGLHEAGNVADGHMVQKRARLPVSYTHLPAHETDSYLVCRLLLE